MQKKQHPKEENTVLLQKLLEGIPYKMLQGTVFCASKGAMDFMKKLKFL